MRIRRVFEEVDSSDDISKELIVSLLDSADLELEKYEIDFIIFTTDDDPTDFGSHGSDCIKYSEYEPDDSIYFTGLSVTFEHNNDMLDGHELGKFANKIIAINNVSHRLESNYDCECFFKQNDYSLNLLIKKMDPSKDDYYYILDNEVSNYVENWFESSEIKKDGTDYYLILKTITDMNNKQQQQKLKEFMDTDFEDISFDKFETIDKRTFRLKNPKIEGIRLN